MARVTVEDCLDKIPNRFELISLASKRARKIAYGVEPLVAAENDKPTVIALREIAEGLIGPDDIKADEKEEVAEALSEALSAVEEGGEEPQA